MKKLLLLAALVATPARADTVSQMEIAYQALNVADFITTEDCLQRGTCHEANPLLGSHPSTARLAAFKLAVGAGHYVLMRQIYHSNPRAARTFEIVSIVMQGGVVGANLRFVF